MGRYYFQTPSPDLEAIAKRLVVWFKQHEYEVDSTKDDQCYFVQAKKTGSLRTLTGTNIAFKITLSPSDVPDEFLCDMATGKWTANIAGAGMTALFTGGATLLTGAMGAAWTYKVERDIVEFMETTLRFKKSRAEGQSPAVDEPMAVHASPPPPPGPKASPQAMPVKQQAKARVASEIARLEEACKAGILTSAELASKKAEAVSKEHEYEVAVLVEERATKLSHALAAGILSQAEYDAKLSHVKEAVENEVKGERQKALHADQLAKLTAARAAGILNDEEYKAKVLALG